MAVRLCLETIDGEYTARYADRGRVFCAGNFPTEREAIEACFYHAEIRRYKRGPQRVRASSPPTKRQPTMTQAIRHAQAPRANERALGCRGVVREGGGYVVKFANAGIRYNFGWHATLEAAIQTYDHQILRIRGETAITNQSRDDILRNQLGL